ncbi:hypothetical protein C8Q75DRAFT_735044 [Abortiporus biennis]|nr:hypothetical protein C8Q75DRAFT_735044 [Abortiporus biennis]
MAYPVALPAPLRVVDYIQPKPHQLTVAIFASIPCTTATTSFVRELRNVPLIRTVSVLPVASGQEYTYSMDGAILFLNQFHVVAMFCLRPDAKTNYTDVTSCFHVRALRKKRHDNNSSSHTTFSKISLGVRDCISQRYRQTHLQASTLRFFVASSNGFESFKSNRGYL